MDIKKKENDIKEPCLKVFNIMTRKDGIKRKKYWFLLEKYN